MFIVDSMGSLVDIVNSRSVKRPSQSMNTCTSGGGWMVIDTDKLDETTLHSITHWNSANSNPPITHGGEGDFMNNGPFRCLFDMSTCRCVVFPSMASIIKQTGKNKKYIYQLIAGKLTQYSGFTQPPVSCKIFYFNENSLPLFRETFAKALDDPKVFVDYSDSDIAEIMAALANGVKDPSISGKALQTFITLLRDNGIKQIKQPVSQTSKRKPAGNDKTNNLPRKMLQKALEVRDNDHIAEIKAALADGGKDPSISGKALQTFITLLIDNGQTVSHPSTKKRKTDENNETKWNSDDDDDNQLIEI
jgi:hypothetical protein